MSINRISLLGVPVDICSPENLENEILELLANPGTKQIIFLHFSLTFWTNIKGDYGDAIKNADLIIPVSKSILKGAKFLKLDVPVRYNPFNAVIQILGILDSHYKSLYLFGSTKKTLSKTEHNIRDTFRNLRIIGRYVGYYPKSVENDIVEAIFKAQPSLVLLSDGIKEKNCWAYRRRNRFSSSIFLYYKDAFGIFSERVKRVSEKTFDRGHEMWFEVMHNPFKVFLIFPYIWYVLSLVWYRLFKKK